MPPKTRFSREDIVEAAFCVVRKHGWEGLSARSIAQELNSSTQPIYSHLKSMKNLEEEIVKKAYELLYTYGTKVRTGDIWLDQGVGYVLFAKQENQLFRCLIDANIATFRKKYRDQLFSSIGEKLSDYPPFEGLSQKQQDKIRFIRIMFMYGLAINISFSKTRTNEKKITDLLREIDQMLLAGFKASLEESKG